MDNLLKYNLIAGFCTFIVWLILILIFYRSDRKFKKRIANYDRKIANHEHVLSIKDPKLRKEEYKRLFGDDSK